MIEVVVHFFPVDHGYSTCGDGLGNHCSKCTPLVDTLPFPCVPAAGDIIDITLKAKNGKYKDESGRVIQRGFQVGDIPSGSIVYLEVMLFHCSDVSVYEEDQSWIRKGVH